MSSWASEDTMLAYEERGQRFRSLLAKGSGTKLGDLHSYEVALLELNP